MSTSRYVLVPLLMDLARAHGWGSPLCETRRGQIVLTLETDSENNAPPSHYPLPPPYRAEP